MIVDIRKSICYYITTAEGDWREWQTNESGTVWYNLMGMSWEELDPPEELIKEFKALVHPAATNGLKG